MPNSRGYSIEVVHGRLSDALRAELAAFWTRHSAIPDPAEARRRIDEVICIARNAGREIVAVNSAYVADFRAPGERYYFYRQFARPQDRMLGLGTALLREAVAFLRKEPGTAKGIVLVAENPKLARPSGRRLLSGLGWTYLGKGPRGFDLWQIEFNDPRSPRSPAGS